MPLPAFNEDGELPPGVHRCTLREALDRFGDGPAQRQVGSDNALLFDHADADAYVGASVFWTRRFAAVGGKQAMIEFWQVRRDGGKRGVIEIVEEEA